MTKTRATRTSLVKDFANKLATGKLKLPKDEFSSHVSGDCEFTFTKRSGNAVIYLFKKGTTDRLATVYMDSNGNVTYKVMPFVDWDVKATRPQPKSTYKAIKNTSYRRSGEYLSGTGDPYSSMKKLRIYQVWKNGEKIFEGHLDAKERKKIASWKGANAYEIIKTDSFIKVRR